MTAITTAVLAYLDEPDQQLQSFALQQLDTVVDYQWAEIASYLEHIENLSEDPNFEARELASIIASRVSFHLGDLEGALTYALGAGSKFDPTVNNEYTHTIIAFSILQYIKEQERLQKSPGPDSLPIDPRLGKLIEIMFFKSLEAGSVASGLGVAVESRRIDLVLHVFKLVLQDTTGNLLESYPGVSSKVDFCREALQLAQTIQAPSAFKVKLVKSMLNLWKEISKPDWSVFVDALIFLQESSEVAQVFHNLLSVESESEFDENIPVAYQISFDLAENTSKQFRTSIQHALDSISNELDSSASNESSNLESSSNSEESTAEESTANSENSEPSPLSEPTPTKSQLHLQRISRILEGDTSIRLYLQFLAAKDASNPEILDFIRSKCSSRDTMGRTAALLAHGIMQAGTCNKQYLVDHPKWRQKAARWTKMATIGSLGVIHRGHLEEALNVLSFYLPSDTNKNPYLQSGSLYALGLIHANLGVDSMIKYLISTINTGIGGHHDEQSQKNAEIFHHGGCLGLGLAAMATGRMDAYNCLKQIFQLDFAVSGEAAAIGIGLTLGATGNRAILDDLVQAEEETEHNKIKRGIGLAIALILYQNQDSMDFIQTLLDDANDPYKRIAGAQALSMAYVGTGNHNALEKLLQLGVSDVSSDVRRIAITSIGFILVRDPEKVPRIVELLVQSYHPYVRYGAAMALGISCAGTGNIPALDLLQDLIEDPENSVRQGALIASSMILMQRSEVKHPRMVPFQSRLYKIMNSRHTRRLTKFGAILSLGILNAGGRNQVISPLTPSGKPNISAIFGLLLFTHHWDWFPIINCLSLALRPTCVIILDSDLRMPKVSLISSAPPSWFKYSSIQKAPTKQTVSTTRLEAVLSTTKSVPSSKASEESSTDSSVPESSIDTSEQPSTHPDQLSNTKSEPPEKKYELLSNPTRITLDQQQYVVIPKQSRYLLVSNHLTGIVMVRDTKPELDPEIVTVQKPTSGIDPFEHEPDPPAIFFLNE